MLTIFVALMDMHLLIEDFGKQLHSAVEIAKSVKITNTKKIENVLISGLGGSGIGATIAAEYCERESAIPVTVSKNYFIPGYVNENTLVIVSSYSGNTEETIMAMESAIERKANIVCITSGGKITELSKKYNCNLVLIPGGMPPRTCLGYSLVQQFEVLHQAGCIKNSLMDEINNAANFIISNRTKIQEEARHIAAFLYGKTPVIYTTSYHEGIAVRWRQQINENAKMLCWHQVVPEMNHNELVGWKQKDDKKAVVFLRYQNEFNRNVKRIEINKDVISKCTTNVFDIYANGNTLLQNEIYFIHLGDWVSFYLAQLNQVDPIEVKVIDHLKGELAKLK